MTRNLLFFTFAGCLVLLAACDKSAKNHSESTFAAVQTSSAEILQGAPSTVLESAPAAETLPEEIAPPPVELADFPTINLLDNRFRWHLYHGPHENLVIPFASEGLWKYTQEYSRPFGKTVEHDGKKGRVLSRTSALLQIPWTHKTPPETAQPQNITARLTMHGGAKGQRVQLNVNGKVAGVKEVAPSWSQVDITIPAALLHEGDNSISMTLRSSSTIAGQKTYGLFHALELGSFAENENTDPPSLPALSPVASVNPEALSGFERLAMYVEIPEKAWLTFEEISPNDPATAPGILIHTASGQTVDLTPESLQGAQAKPLQNPQNLQIDLGQFANQLVLLELSGSHTLWKNPRIALEKTSPKSPPGPVDNVVLLVVDTLRSDRLKLYGETRVETPHFTAAGQHAAVFLNNQATTPSSPPSHASLQTGMIPRVHGVAGDKGQLKPGTQMLSNLLGQAGIATAYVGNNSFGMNRLRASGEWTAFHQPVSEGLGIDCTALNKKLLEVAKNQIDAGKRFFISALPFEPHVPYRFHEGITEKYHDGSWNPPVGKFADGYLLVDIMAGRKAMNAGQWSQLEALYDGEVEYMDRCFHDLQEGLKELGVGDSTAIVLTSDHGEGMNERGRLGHVYGHYAELSNVPFVVFSPHHFSEATGPINVSTPTSCIDVAPTVLDLMGVPHSEAMQGESVMPLAYRNGPWSPRVVSTEYGRSYSLRSKDWRFIVNYDGSQELYDLTTDPKELTNVIEQNSFGRRYLRELAGVFLEHRSEWKHASWGSYANHGAGYIAALEE